MKVLLGPCSDNIAGANCSAISRPAKRRIRAGYVKTNFNAAMTSTSASRRRKVNNENRVLPK